MLNVPWISPELEFWKRRQSSKSLSVLAGLQLPAKLLCSAQTGWSQARVLLLTGSLQHRTPSPLLLPAGLAPKHQDSFAQEDSHSTLCIFPPGQEEEEESEEWLWGGGLLDLMAKGQEGAGRSCRERAGGKSSRASPKSHCRPLASLFMQG